MRWRRRAEHIPYGVKGIISMPTVPDEPIDIEAMAPGGLPPAAIPGVERIARPSDVPGLKLRALTVNPGDVLIIETSKRMTYEQFNILRQQIKAAIPEARALILEDGMTVRTASLEEVEESTNNDTENLHHDSTVPPGLDPGDTRGTRAEGTDA